MVTCEWSTLSAEVFAALDAGTADAAVIPIENSLAGSVLEHFDLLLKHDVKVVEETLLRIRHNLIAMPGASMARSTACLSHPVALAQCRRFLAAHPADEGHCFLRHRGQREATGGAARPACGGNRQRGGGGVLTARRFSQRGIEDNPENYTRFFLVRRAAAEAE